MSSSPTFGQTAHRILKLNFQKTIKQEADVLRDEDPEALHDMRVGMRRIRVALQVFQRAIELPKVINDKSIRQIARILGAVRDADVLSAELETRFYPEVPRAEQKRLNQVLSHLQTQRQQDFQKLVATLEGSLYRKLKQAFQTWLAQPQFTPIASLPITSVAPDLWMPLTSEILLHPGWLVGSEIQENQITFPTLTAKAVDRLLQQEGEILHHLRKQMKGMRYQMEFLVNCYDGIDQSQLQARINDFKQVQDVLGQFQDIAVLQAVLETTLENKLKTTLPHLRQTLRQRRTELWEEWQPIQQHYLDAQFRAAIRERLITPHLGPATETVDQQANVLLNHAR